jgi:hypothetical protein
VRRYGRAPHVVPMPIRPAPLRARRRQGQLVIRAHTTPRTDTSCVWALDSLRFWGVDAKLLLATGISAPVFALARTLGLAGQVAAEPCGEADIGLFLAVPGEASLTRALTQAACSGLPCVASRGVAEGFDCPAWVSVTPEGSSPLLLAEAILAAVARRPDPHSVLEFQRRHDPWDCARLICEALGLAS